MSSVIPPGLDNRGVLSRFASGGDTKDWLPYTKIKLYTNAFIVKDNKVLLGFKKRGFGKGKYNGFGGKVDPGETSLQAAVRELQEESGVTAPLEHAGTLFFVSEGEDWAFEIEIYRADSYEGDITESDEMRPEWFSTVGVLDGDSQSSTIPFSKMWESDIVWFPYLISKRKFAGRADFTREGDEFRLHRWWYGTVSDSSSEQ
ncbi:7,8-dihydro-8-oxoguanine triphosphatase [Psilocybe cubensis]|uniref:7,8-dihydro-8-oxoguanine triphosphatase n=2 Tax=Psilocybe cubensis TaxID=181762 RepID=A0ACB8GR53_PSICU|nr:7,8-dihydro-8-oxoguanine triphosphatase [Psilocybe cubensis]KAH9477514.1 7,8-dihydro-8-oxoguanine triphosphatase [Psilocybe cubensis]